jgi:nitrogen fixation protein FixH
MTAKRRIPAHIFWPGMVVGLLSVSLTAATITVVAAVGDSSFAVEKDYYTKGLEWDAHVAQQRHNEELGWSAEIGRGGPDAAGHGTLEVRLLDRVGIPLEGAQVEATYFHFTNKAGAVTVNLAAAKTAGVYAAAADLGREGLWSVALVVKAEGETFTAEQTLDLEER